MGCEPLHSHAEVDQIDTECRGRGCKSVNKLKCTFIETESMQYGSHLPLGAILKPQHLVTLGIALSLGAFSQTNAQASVASAGEGPTF